MTIRGNWRGNAEMMHEIRPGLWLGSIGAENQKYRELEAKGITHVLQVMLHMPFPPGPLFGR